ncbi:MAG: hypothetical protein HQL93_04200 [Magnetococcales bacterium]|nr:hypothetical protein [Magnetococcales bacterium]
MGLNREQILDAVDLKTVAVDIPEWGGSVNIRTFTGAVRDEFMTTMKEKQNGPVVDASALLVSLSVVGDDGQRLFSKADLTTINGKSGLVIGRLANEIMKLNQMGPEGDKETEKNSEKGQTE